MIHLTPVNCFLLLAGLTMNFLYAIRKTKKKDKNFSFGYFIKDNWITMMLTIIAGISSLIMADDIMKMLHISTDGESYFYNVHAIISGLLPLQIFDKIKKLYK